MNIQLLIKLGDFEETGLALDDSIAMHACMIESLYESICFLSLYR